MSVVPLFLSTKYITGLEVAFNLVTVKFKIAKPDDGWASSEDWCEIVLERAESWNC